MNTPDDPVEDPLKQLDERLPDIFGYNSNEFDLALQFDIQRYVDILADSISDPQKTSDSLSRLGRETSLVMCQLRPEARGQAQSGQKKPVQARPCAWPEAAFGLACEF